MNKSVFVIGAVIGLITACHSQSKPTSVSTSPVVPAIQSQVMPRVVAADLTRRLTLDAFFAMPSDWHDVNTEGEGGIVIEDPLKVKRALFTNETFQGNIETFSNIILTGIRSDGGNITPISIVNINGNSFVHSSILINEDIVSYIWLAVKNNTGYIFVCGSRQSDISETCNAIASTIQIK